MSATEERVKVREALIALGFKRVSYTRQELRPTKYTETWGGRLASVTIEWTEEPYRQEHYR
jgi:hypothetical protein